jgi:hypothetical protein
MTHSNRGLWKQSRERIASAFEILQGRVHGAQWDIDAGQVYDQIAAFQRGDFLDLASVTPSIVEQGFSRDRIWVGAMLSGQFGTAAWLCADDTTGYQRSLESAKARWQPEADAQWPDYFLVLGQAALDLYRNEPVNAAITVERVWPWLARSLFSRAQMANSFALCWRGTAAAAALRVTSDPKYALVVRDCKTRLARLDLGYASAYRSVLDASLSMHARDGVTATKHLRAAIDGFDANDMCMYAAAARRRLGELVGGDEGTQLLARGDASMRAQGVVNLDAMTEMLCAGCRAHPRRT